MSSGDPFKPQTIIEEWIRRALEDENITTTITTSAAPQQEETTRTEEDTGTTTTESATTEGRPDNRTYFREEELSPLLPQTWNTFLHSVVSVSHLPYRHPNLCTLAILILATALPVVMGTFCSCGGLEKRHILRPQRVTLTGFWAVALHSAFFVLRGLLPESVLFFSPSALRFLTWLCVCDVAYRAAGTAFAPQDAPTPLTIGNRDVGLAHVTTLGASAVAAASSFAGGRDRAGVAIPPLARNSVTAVAVAAALDWHRLDDVETGIAHTAALISWHLINGVLPLQEEREEEEQDDFLDGSLHLPCWLSSSSSSSEEGKNVICTSYTVSPADVLVPGLVVSLMWHAGGPPYFAAALAAFVVLSALTMLPRPLETLLCISRSPRPRPMAPFVHLEWRMMPSWVSPHMDVFLPSLPLPRWTMATGVVAAPLILARAKGKTAHLFSYCASDLSS